MDTNNLKCVWITLIYVHAVAVLIHGAGFAIRGFTPGGSGEILAMILVLQAAFWWFFIRWWRRATPESRQNLFSMKLDRPSS